MSLEVAKTTLMSSEAEFSLDKLELIKRTICPGISDLEFDFFIQVCKRTGLNPLLRQIYSIPRGNARTIQISIDGYRTVADRTGKYAPGRESTFVYDADKKMVSATAYVMKMTTDGKWHEVACSAYWAEYNANQGLWKKMPHVMLSKCAEAAALRKAFPAEFLGTYAEEEMDQAGKALIIEEPEKITLGDLDKKIDGIRIQLPFEEHRLFAEHMAFSKDFFKGKYKEGWLEKFGAFLDGILANVEQYKKDLYKWHEKQVAKKAEAK